MFRTPWTQRARDRVHRSGSNDRPQVRPPRARCGGLLPGHETTHSATLASWSHLKSLAAVPRCPHASMPRERLRLMIEWANICPRLAAVHHTAVILVSIAHSPEVPCASRCKRNTVKRGVRAATGPGCLSPFRPQGWRLQKSVCACSSTANSQLRLFVTVYSMSFPLLY